jgi:lipopolysaccharide export system permease protein
MRIADRYVLRHLVLPSVIGLAIFICIMLAEVAWRISGVLVASRVSVGMLAKYFLLSVPRLAVWSIPVAMLLGVSMAMTGLERHGEITAMRSGGRGLARIQTPWIVLGALASALAIWVTQVVVPDTTQRADELFQWMTFQAPVVKQAYDQLFRSPDGRLFFVRKMDAERNVLENVTIWHTDRQGRVRQIELARQARVEGRQWVLLKGYSRRFAADGRPLGAPEEFVRRPVVLWAAIHQYYADKRTPYEMSITELQDLSRVLEAGGKDAHQLLVHLHFKYSIPCAALVFVLLAAPLAHRYARLGSFAGLVLAIVILFLYNGVRSWTLALGLAGSMPPAVAGWVPNLVFGALGVALVWKQK